MELMLLPLSGGKTSKEIRVSLAWFRCSITVTGLCFCKIEVQTYVLNALLQSMVHIVFVFVIMAGTYLETNYRFVITKNFIADKDIK